MQQKVQDQLVQIQAQLKDIQGLLAAQSQAAVQKSKDLVAQLTPQQKKVAVGVAAALGLYSVVRVGGCVCKCVSYRRRLADIEKQKEDGKLHLYMMPRSPWSPSLSGPCSKLETFLRLAEIEYETVETMDMRGSPNGMVPFIVYRGKVIADSRRIIEFLSTEFHVKMDIKLNRLERATGTALVEMVDFNMNATFFRLAFIEHPQVARALLSKAFHVPGCVARLYVRRFASYLHSRLRVTAAGSLTAEQYENEFLRDCEAIEQQIGEKPFLFGDEPTSYDCAVYGVLIAYVRMKQHAEVSEAYMAVSQSPILVEYLHRLTERAFPDLEEVMNATEEARSELAESMAGDELHAEEHEAAPEPELVVVAVAGERTLEVTPAPAAEPAPEPAAAPAAATPTLEEPAPAEPVPPVRSPHEL